MCPVLELRRLRWAQQAQPYLVNKRGRLQRLVPTPPPQIRLGNRVQLPMNLWCELFERGSTPLTPLSQQTRDRNGLFYKIYSVTKRISPKSGPKHRVSGDHHHRNKRAIENFVPR